MTPRKGGWVAIYLNSLKPILAVFRKEWQSESRSLSGITTTALLCLVGVVIVNTITWTTSINPLVGAGLYWLILVFSASVSLPRIFLNEEETKSADFWRLVAKPEAVFWGKFLFNAVQMLIATAFISVAFIITMRVEVKNPILFLTTAFGGAVAIASTATLSGALAAPAQNRSALAAAISVPIQIFLVNLGITGTATAFGEGLRGGNMAGLAMISYSIATCSLGPVVYSKIWKG